VTSTEPVHAPDVVVKKRGSETAWDMVRSLGLVGLVIALTLIFVPALTHPSGKDEIPPVNYADYLSGFHQLTGKVVPTPNPARIPGWRANAGTLTGPVAVEHVHVGFAVPGSKYAGLEEGVGSPALFINKILGAGGAAAQGTVMIAGRPWQVRLSDRGEYALSRTIHGVTVVVTGSATVDQQQALAGALVP
jgi:Protein of unknown function (DUF4245)